MRNQNFNGWNYTVSDTIPPLIEDLLQKSFEDKSLEEAEGKKFRSLNNDIVFGIKINLLVIIDRNFEFFEHISRSM